MPIAAQIFGDFVEPDELQISLQLVFALHQSSLQSRWLNNSLSARFVANYCGTFFPLHSPAPEWNRSEIEEMVCYMANELLDNAVKYGMTSPHTGMLITLHLCVLCDVVRIYVSNPIPNRLVRSFQEYIQSLLTSDPAMLYFDQMERNAREGEAQVSRLGLLSMIHDYHAQLSWKFAAFDSSAEELSVTTMVQFSRIRPQERIMEDTLAECQESL